MGWQEILAFSLASPQTATGISNETLDHVVSDFPIPRILASL